MGLQQAKTHKSASSLVQPKMSENDDVIVDGSGVKFVPHTIRCELDGSYMNFRALRIKLPCGPEYNTGFGLCGGRYRYVLVPLNEKYDDKSDEDIRALFTSHPYLVCSNEGQPDPDYDDAEDDAPCP